MAAREELAAMASRVQSPLVSKRVALAGDRTDQQMPTHQVDRGR
jgi:hypothetical protein